MATESLLTEHGLSRFVCGLARSAAARDGIPDDLMVYASRATLRRFSAIEGPLEPAEKRRVRAYFRAVVRRRSIRSRGDSLQEVRQLYLVASIAEDLRAAGRSPHEIMSEIRSDHGRYVSPEVLARLWLTVRTWETGSDAARHQKTVDTITSPEVASKAQTRDLSKVPSADPQTSTTIHASRSSTRARSA